MAASLGLAASLGVNQFLALAAFGLLGALYGVKLIPLNWARHLMGIRRLKDLPASCEIGIGQKPPGAQMHHPGTR